MPLASIVPATIAIPTGIDEEAADTADKARTRIDPVIPTIAAVLPTAIPIWVGVLSLDNSSKKEDERDWC